MGDLLTVSSVPDTTSW